MNVLEFLSKGCEEPSRTFLLIGAYAVNAHGFSRFTRDLDVLTSKEQRGYWKELMLQNGYNVYFETDNFMQFNSAALENMAVDFMLVNETTFARLNADPIKQVIGGVTVKLPNLMNLIALKLHVAKQELEHRQGKDLYDIMELVHINKVNVRSGEFRQWCERFGNPKLYEAIIQEHK